MSLGGLALIIAARLGLSRFELGVHLAHEWVKLANLFGLLVGFVVLADHFERSHVTSLLPRLLPRGAFGCFVLLAFVWLLSALLDNIAAAVIGATAAAGVFERRVHLGYLAAIVAAANAGGAGSVPRGHDDDDALDRRGEPSGDPSGLRRSASALVVFGACAALQQHRFSPIAVSDAGVKRNRRRSPRDRGVRALGDGVHERRGQPSARSQGQSLPFLALALWLVLLAATPLRSTLVEDPARGGPRQCLPARARALGLLDAVEALPTPSWRGTLGLGFVSALFDNIPLTKLALTQGGYDWALLAYSVGVGGSMIWFGSSAGVAIAGMFPEGRSVVRWTRAAWHVPVGFLVGFFTLYLVRGWNP